MLILAGALLYGVIDTYGRYGKGVEFFPDIEPDTAVVLIHARGNISLAEKDAMVRAVEATMLDMPELETVYARSGEMDRGADGVTEDVVGPDPVHLRRLEEAAEGRRDHGRDPREDRPSPRLQGRGDGAAGRSADRQADPGPTRQL